MEGNSLQPGPEHYSSIFSQKWSEAVREELILTTKLLPLNQSLFRSKPVLVGLTKKQLSRMLIPVIFIFHLTNQHNSGYLMNAQLMASLLHFNL